MKHCPHGHRPLIAIDPYGERLTGYLEKAGGKSLFGLNAFGFFNHLSAHQKGGVCRAKYPKSWIVNIAAHTISIRIKARVLNLITPPQRARTVALGEALMRRLPLFEMRTSFFFWVVTKRAQAEPPTWLRSAPFRHGSDAKTSVPVRLPKGRSRAGPKAGIRDQRDQFA